MPTSTSSSARTRRPRAASLLVLVLAVALTALIVARSLEGSSSSAAPPSVGATTATVTPVQQPDQEAAGGPGSDPPGSEDGSRDGVGAADGRLPAAVTVDDERFPALTRLDPALLAALREAATDASGDGTTFLVTSGWRSRSYQQQLLDQAVATYGSEEEAARWVATPDTSPHVSGEAVDLGPDGATGWLSEHGSRYGLCQVYANEPWHYELRPDAVEHGCPDPYADPTQDPRMQG